MKTIKFLFGAVLSFALLFALTGSVPATVGLSILGMIISAVVSTIPGVAFLLINPSDLTWNGKEVMDIAETIMEDAFNNPNIDEFHTVVEGIVAKQQIGYLGRLSKITKADTGCGSTPDTSKNIEMTEKFWDPVALEIWLELCYSDLEASFFIWGQNKGYKRSDLETDKSKVVEFVLEKMSEAALEDALRIAWFSDTDAALSDDSPAGTLSPAADVDDYNTLDAFWKQLYAIVATTPTRRYTIDENAEATYADQLDLATDRALKMARAMLQDCDKRLKGSKDKIFIWTDTLVDNYQTYLESQGVDKSYERIEDFESGLTFTGMYFRNVPIYRFDLWDRTIQEDFDNGTTYYQPHRAVLTTKANLAIGVDSKSMINTFESWLERKDKKVNLRGSYKIDVKIVKNYMVQLAY